METTKITVIDLESNEEFELIDIGYTDSQLEGPEIGEVVIRNDKYGFCRQKISKIKFTNNQIGRTTSF